MKNVKSRGLQRTLMIRQRVRPLCWAAATGTPMRSISFRRIATTTPLTTAAATSTSAWCSSRSQLTAHRLYLPQTRSGVALRSRSITFEQEWVVGTQRTRHKGYSAEWKEWEQRVGGPFISACPCGDLRFRISWNEPGCLKSRSYVANGTCAAEKLHLPGSFLIFNRHSCPSLWSSWWADLRPVRGESGAGRNLTLRFWKGVGVFRRNSEPGRIPAIFPWQSPLLRFFSNGMQ